MNSRWKLPSLPARLGDAYIFSAFIRDITARKRTERQLASQYAVTRVLAESRTLEEAGPKILQAICESLEWELGIFWRLDRQGSVLRCLDVWQSPGLNAEEFVLDTWRHTFALGKGLPGRIWQAGNRRGSGRRAGSEFPSRRCSFARGITWRLQFPVRVGTEVEGVIELFRREIKQPDEQLLKMVADVGLKIGSSANEPAPRMPCDARKRSCSSRKNGNRRTTRRRRGARFQ